MDIGFIADTIDWKNIRATKMSAESPPDWDKDIKGISLNGLTLFGVSQKTGNLYWDGKEIVVKKEVTLRTYELVLATCVTLATVGVFVVEAGRSLGLWQ
jgi:hypothetical protein